MGLIAQEKEGRAEVAFFDVGQGDSAFIETSKHFQVLIDGGPTPAILEKLGKEMPFYDKTIDLIVLSHPDSDHLTGLIDALKRYRIKNILWTGILNGTEESKEWAWLIEEEGADIIIAKAGEKIILQEDPGIYISVLYPFESVKGKEIENTNDYSIVGKLVFENASILFCGDISSNIEKRLIEQNADLDADVLKVAHHGSKYSTSEEFLKAVSPETAVISAGKNTWGHPALETLQRLEDSGIKILITKELGDLKFSF